MQVHFATTIKRIFYISFFLCPITFGGIFAQSGTTDLLKQLDEAIEKKGEFMKQKLSKIERLKMGINPILPLPNQFNSYDNLYKEYRTFQYDSAFHYALKLQEIAQKINEPVKLNYAKLQLSFTLLSSGMYKECLESLNSIQINAMPDSIKVEYYILFSRFYYELGTYNGDVYYLKRYNNQGKIYSDSALKLMNPQSLQYYFVSGIKALKERNFEKSKTDFSVILDKFNPQYRDYAMTASALASVYLELGEREKATNLMIEAAIGDIKSCTKEGLALVYVADLLYHENDDENAYRYIKEALNDANFYRAKLRLKHVAGILPLIEGNRLTTVEGQKNRMFIFTILVSILSVLVLIFAYIIFSQLKKLKKADKEIIKANTRLQDTNEVLQTTNNELLEANKIKEEYIGYSFNVYAEYLDKIEKIKKNIEKKLTAKNYEGIAQTLDGINIKKEREVLYLSFDKAFIQLFPNFIPAFNALFKTEDRYQLKEGQPLNLDLRIFALIRIGISDHEQIAKILEYSVRTIYNHKTLVKSKSIIPNDEFEQRIMEIKAF